MDETIQVILELKARGLDEIRRVRATIGEVFRSLPATADAAVRRAAQAIRQFGAVGVASMAALATQARATGTHLATLLGGTGALGVGLGALAGHARNATTVVTSFAGRMVAAGGSMLAFVAKSTIFSVIFARIVGVLGGARAAVAGWGTAVGATAAPTAAAAASVGTFARGLSVVSPLLGVFAARAGVAFGLLKPLALGLGIMVGAVGLLIPAYIGAVRASIAFNQSLADLSAITGATGDDLEVLRHEAIRLSETTTQSATDVARAFTLIASKKPELLESSAALADVTAKAITLAEAAGLDVPAAATALTSALNQFQAPASEAGRFINVMAAGAKFAAAEIPELTQALVKSGTEASGAGLSFEELNATIQALAGFGTPISKIGTSLRNLFLIVAKEGHGATLSSQGLAAALEEMGIGVNSGALAAKRFGTENATVAVQVVRAKGAIKTLLTQLTGTNVAYEQAAIRTDTLAGDITRLGNAWDALKLKIGSTNEGLVRTAIQGFEKLVKLAGDLGIALGLIGEAPIEAAKTTLLRLGDELRQLRREAADVASGAAAGAFTDFAREIEAKEQVLREASERLRQLIRPGPPGITPPQPPVVEELAGEGEESKIKALAEAVEDLTRRQEAAQAVIAGYGQGLSEAAINALKLDAEVVKLTADLTAKAQAAGASTVGLEAMARATLVAEDAEKRLADARKFQRDTIGETTREIALLNSGLDENALAIIRAGDAAAKGAPTPELATQARAYAEELERLRQQQQATAESSLDLGETLRESVGQVFDSLVSGTRKIGDTLQGLGLALGKRVFDTFIKSKLKDFDAKINVNITRDVPKMFERGGTAIVAANAKTMGTVAQDATTAFDTVGTASTDATQVIADSATQVQGSWGGFFGFLLQLAQSVIGQVVGLFQGLASVIGQLLGSFSGGGILGAVGSVFGAIGSLFGGSSAAGLSSSSSTGVGSIIGGFVSAAKVFGGELFASVAEVFKPLTDGLKMIGTSITNSLGSGVKTLISTVREVVGVLGGLASVVGGIVAAVQGQGALNKGIGALGALSGLQTVGSFFFGATDIGIAIAGALAQTGNPFLISLANAVGAGIQGPGVLDAIRVAVQTGAEVGTAAGAEAGAEAAAAAAPAGASIVSLIANVVAVAGLVYSVATAAHQLAKSHAALTEQTRGDSSADVLTGIQAAILAGFIAGGALIGSIVPIVGTVVGAAIGAAVATAVNAALTKGVSKGISEATKGGVRHGLVQAEVEDAIIENVQGNLLLNILSGGMNIKIAEVLGPLVTPDIERLLDKFFVEFVQKTTGQRLNRNQNDFFGQGVGPAGRPFLDQFRRPPKNVAQVNGTPFGGAAGESFQDARDIAALIAGIVGAGSRNEERVRRFFHIFANGMATARKSAEEVRKIIDKIVVKGVGSLAGGLRLVNVLFAVTAKQLASAQERGGAHAERAARHIAQAKRIGALVTRAFQPFVPTVDLQEIVDRNTKAGGGINVEDVRRDLRIEVLQDAIAGDLEITKKLGRKLGDVFLLTIKKISRDLPAAIDLLGLALAIATRDLKHSGRVLRESLRVQQALFQRGLPQLSTEQAADIGEAVKEERPGRARRRLRDELTLAAIADQLIEVFIQSVTDGTVAHLEAAQRAIEVSTHGFEVIASDLPKGKKKREEALQQAEEAALKSIDAVQAWGDAVLALIQQVADGIVAIEDYGIALDQELASLRDVEIGLGGFDAALASATERLALAVSATGKLAATERLMTLEREKAAAQIENLQAELSGVSALAGLRDTVRAQIADLEDLSSAGGSSLDLLAEQIADARGRFFGAGTDEERATAAQDLQGLLAEQVTLAGDTFGLASSEFAAIRQAALDDLHSIELAAIDAETREEEIAADIKAIRVALADRLEALGTAALALLGTQLQEQRDILSTIFPDPEELDRILSDPAIATLAVLGKQTEYLEVIATWAQEALDALGKKEPNGDDGSVDVGGPDVGVSAATGGYVIRAGNIRVHPHEVIVPLSDSRAQQALAPRGPATVIHINVNPPPPPAGMTQAEMLLYGRLQGRGIAAELEAYEQSKSRRRRAV